MKKKHLKFEVTIYGLTEPVIDINHLLQRFSNFMDSESLDHATPYLPKPKYLIDSPVLTVTVGDIEP